MIDLDSLDYVLFEGDTEQIKAGFSLPRDEAGIKFIKDSIQIRLQEHYQKSYASRTDVYVYKNDIYALVISSTYELLAIEIEGTILNIM